MDRRGPRLLPAAGLLHCEVAVALVDLGVSTEGVARTRLLMEARSADALGGGTALTVAAPATAFLCHDFVLSLDEQSFTV